LKTTLLGLVLAVVGGVGLAVLLSLSRIVEYSLYPYAVVLQVTPVIAISPLLLIYMPQEAAVLACAWIVAFFPILSNTGARPAVGRPQPARTVRTYGASRPKGWPAFVGRLLSRFKALWVLRRPAALPYFLAWAEDRRRAVAHRCGGGRDRGRLGRSRLGPRLPDRREPVSPQHPTPVAAAGAPLARGRGDLLLLSAVSHLLLRRWHESALATER
jgi:NitT/TauT family transport system permease protein